MDRQELDSEAVKKTRALEIEWHTKMNRHKKRPIEECFEKTMKPPIKVKCIDRNKGDRQNVNVRSGLLAKPINTGKEEGLFAATPPLEALRMLLSTTVIGNKSKALMFNDICSTYLHGRIASYMDVELCEEDKTEPGYECSRKEKHHHACSGTGKETSKHSPPGEGAKLEWLCKRLKKKFETKMITMGEDDDMAKEARVLNRIVRWHPRERTTHEAVQSWHRSRESQDHLNTGCEGNEKGTGGGDETRFERAQSEWKVGKQDEWWRPRTRRWADEVTEYKWIAAQANFLAQDRMDIACATKEATRRMTVPTTDDWNKLVRLGRHPDIKTRTDQIRSWRALTQIGPGAEEQEDQR